jgi:hypothetical protein
VHMEGMLRTFKRCLNPSLTLRNCSCNFHYVALPAGSLLAQPIPTSRVCR